MVLAVVWVVVWVVVHRLATKVVFSLVFRVPAPVNQLVVALTTSVSAFLLAAGRALHPLLIRVGLLPELSKSIPSRFKSADLMIMMMVVMMMMDLMGVEQ